MGWNPGDEDPSGWHPEGWQPNEGAIGETVGSANCSVTTSASATGAIVGSAIVDVLGDAQGSGSQPGPPQSGWAPVGWDGGGWQPSGWQPDQSLPVAIIATASVSVEVQFSADLVDADGPWQADVSVSISASAKGILVRATGPKIIDPRLYVERKQDNRPQYRFGSGFRTRDFFSRKR